MGNICDKISPSKSVGIGPTTLIEGEVNDEERETKSVVTRRATKGKGLLGKTSWSDEEDEDEENGEKEIQSEKEEQTPECGEVAPMLNGGDASQKQQKTSAIAINTETSTNNEGESSTLNVIYISNISQDDMQSKMDKIQAACFKTMDDNNIEKDSRICIYNGQLYKEHNNMDIDAAMTRGKAPDDIDQFPVLSQRSGCQLISKKHNEMIGILALDDIDEDGKWLEYARNEANKMLKHDQPDIIIAICQCGVIQAKKMAMCNIPGIKCILCIDEVLPSDETIELGTIIVTLNPAEKRVAQINIKFDNFHQPDFGKTMFLNFDG